MVEESHKDKNTPGQETMDEVVEMKDNVCVGPFPVETSKGRITQVPAQDTHVMVVPIRHTDVVHGKTHPLPPDYKCCMCTPCSQLVASRF